MTPYGARVDIEPGRNLGGSQGRAGAPDARDGNSGVRGGSGASGSGLDATSVDHSAPTGYFDLVPKRRDVRWFAVVGAGEVFVAISLLVFTDKRHIPVLLGLFGVGFLAFARYLRSERVKASRKGEGRVGAR